MQRQRFRVHRTRKILTRSEVILIHIIEALQNSYVPWILQILILIYIQRILQILMVLQYKSLVLIGFLIKALH